MDKINNNKNIIHLFPKSQFTEGFVLFIEKNFNIDKHTIILYTNKKFELSDKIYNKKFVYDFDQENLNWLRRKLICADTIILHNLSVTFDMMNLFIVNPRLTKRSIWIIWGGDLHCYSDKKNSLVDHYVEFMRKNIIKHLKGIGTLTLGDYQLVQEWYHSKAPNFRVDYYSDEYTSIIKELKKTNSRLDNEVKVLIGNSATKSNCHTEIFEVLEKFKNEKIKLIVPISYGDMDYASKIKEYGKKIYGDKIVFLEKYLDRKSYFKIISQVDIGIFNNNRQQALGNIYALVYMGKKVYLRKNTAMWDEFVELNNYQINSIEELYNNNWLEFLNYDSFQKGKNISMAEPYFDEKIAVKQWEKVFQI